MPLSGIILVTGESGWQIGTETFRSLDLAADASPETAASASCGGATGSGLPGEDVVLAIPSTWCLIATIPAMRKGKGRRRDMLAMALEEQFPIPAEEFVADYVEAGQKLLGIAGRSADDRAAG